MADKRKNDTKLRLIQLTEDTIRKKGFLNLSQREIVKGLGLSPGAFYNHFENKEALFHDVLLIVSQKTYNAYQKKHGEELRAMKPADALVLYGKFVLSLFQKQRHLMDFLFLSPTALTAYSASLSSEDTSFDMLREIYRLIDAVIEEYDVPVSRELLLIKLWSFFQGYSQLISASVVDYCEFLIEEAVYDVIAGCASRKANPNA